LYRDNTPDTVIPRSEAERTSNSIFQHMYCRRATGYSLLSKGGAPSPNSAVCGYAVRRAHTSPEAEPIRTLSYATPLVEQLVVWRVREIQFRCPEGAVGVQLAQSWVDDGKATGNAVRSK